MEYGYSTPTKTEEFVKGVADVYPYTLPISAGLAVYYVMKGDASFAAFWTASVSAKGMLLLHRLLKR